LPWNKLVLMSTQKEQVSNLVHRNKDSYCNLQSMCSSLGRFIQPDSIVPEAAQGVQAWDRYAYANNSPIVYNDPSGHCIFGIDTIICVALAGAAIGAAVGYGAQVIRNYRNGS
jgi:RHS repeat-associated protein